MLDFVQRQYLSDQYVELVSKCEFLQKENSLILDCWTFQSLIVDHLWSEDCDHGNNKMIVLILS